VSDLMELSWAASSMWAWSSWTCRLVTWQGGVKRKQ
jgi:hypothetical protein